MNCCKCVYYIYKCYLCINFIVFYFKCSLYSIFESINIGFMLVNCDIITIFILFINEVYEVWYLVVI